MFPMFTGSLREGGFEGLGFKVSRGYVTQGSLKLPTTS